MTAGKSKQDLRYLAAAREHGAMIARLARGYEADPELRRDLAQDIHAALWRSFAIYEGQCSEKSWVHRIAHNVDVSHMITGRGRRLPLVGLEDMQTEAAGPPIWQRWVALAVIGAVITSIWWLNQLAARRLQERIDEIDALTGRTE